MSSSNKDYYKVLGLGKDADKEEIKKKYKKLAKQYHPDRNKDNKEEAENKFKEISVAYSILSDDEKKKRYDMFGDDGMNGDSGMHTGNAFDIFSSVFGGGVGGGGFNPFGNSGFNPFGNSGFNPFGNNQPVNKSKKKSSSKKVKINVNLDDLYNGKNLNIDYLRKNKCKTCDGSGVKDNSSFINCNLCNGSGQVTSIKQFGPMIQRLSQICTKCNGKGKTIKPNSECLKCKGTKIEKEKINLNLFIYPGTKSGTEYKFDGKSDWEPDYGYPGDFIVIVNEVIPNKCIFKREGSNLIIQKNISVKDALIGFKFRIKHLDNRILELNYNKILHPDQIMMVKGEGMPLGKNELGNGDLIIRFNIIFPNKLDEARCKYLSKILPSLQLTENELELNNNDDVETKEMTSYIMNNTNENYKTQEFDDLQDGNIECHPQ